MSDLYKPPEVRVADPEIPDSERAPLASRIARLGARIIDGLIYLGPFVVAMIALGAFAPSQNEPDDAIVGITLVGAALWVLGVFAYNLYLLSKRGQTIGKRATNIKIVRLNHDQAGLGRIFFLRMFLPSVFSNIPLVGPFFGLINILLIFGPERRCIHDFIADTIVVESSP